MTTDKLLSYAQDHTVWLATGAGLGIAVLVLLAAVLRRKARPKLARRVTTLATLLGLAWSAQGMWDVAVHHYGQTVGVASVLFVVFESMQVAKMLRAHDVRTDRVRRAKPAAFVWVTAVVMALVVSLGEGWGQAPARMAIPLLVAYGWWTDLTFDDDPAERTPTTRRWTMHRLLLRVGAIEPGKNDDQSINRKRLQDQMVRLAFRQQHSWPWLNEALRRDIRLARLKTEADLEDLRAARLRLSHMNIDLIPTEAPVLHTPEPERRRLILPPAPDTRRAASVQGVHQRNGKMLRGDDLRADAVLLKRSTPGMTIADLRAAYDPPLKERTAQTFSAEASKVMNGNVVREEMDNA